MWRLFNEMQPVECSSSSSLEHLAEEDSGAVQRPICTHLAALPAVWGFIASGFPALALIAYLCWRLKPNLEQLRRADSLIMRTYYYLLWCISAFSVLRAVAQLGIEGTGHAVGWNILSLVYTFGLVFLEVSAMTFLLQGYLTTGRQALLRTLYTSGAISAAYTLLSALLVFAAHIPLYLYGGDPVEGCQPGDMSWRKWGVLLGSSLVFGLVYGAFAVLPATHLRDLLPLKRSYARYVEVLAVLYLLRAVGAALVGAKITAGYCVYVAATWCYHAGYPLLVYAVFLHDFFDGSGGMGPLDLDLMYYSEMHEAGMFDEY